MNVFLTGSTGFLGGHLASAFRGRGGSVVGLVHDGHSGLERDLDHWVYGSVLDRPLLERAIAEYEIDCVIHLAAQAQTSVASADPTNTLKTNIEGAWNVLESARRLKVKRVVVASTDKAYGEHAQACSEVFALEASAPYEVSKACADMIARAFARTYAMSVGVTRCANLYGPGHLNWSTLIPGTIRRILRAERPKVFAGGAQRREFLHVDDACRAYLMLADSEFIGALNFGGGETFTALEVVEKVKALMGCDLPNEDVAGRASDIRAQKLDCHLASRALGWKPGVSFHDGLSNTVEWYRRYFAGKGIA